MRIIYFLIILTSTIMLGCFWGCKHKPETEAITYMADSTEANFIHVSLEAISNISLWHKEPGSGNITRIVPITELAFNKIDVLKFDAVSHPLLNNEFERDQALNTYQKRLRTSLLTLDSITEDRPGSVIYQVVATELNLLAINAANHRTLILNSDLMELSSTANFYDSVTFDLLVKAPDSMIRKFEALFPLKELHGMEVYLIYQPQTQLDSRRFEVTSAFYKQLLTEKGATVYIGANLITQTIDE